MRSVRFPEMRLEVVRALQALADPQYQRRVWIDREYPHPGFFDDFSLNVHILYDDTRVLEIPFETIGSVLTSEAEAAVMERLAQVLDSMFDRMGTERGDEDYVYAPEWSFVVERAKEALAVLREE